MEEFKKEDRYLVIKREELDHVLNNIMPIESQSIFRCIVDVVEIYRASLGKKPLDCVIAKAGTPEYDEVWRAIEQRWKENQHQIERQRRNNSKDIDYDNDDIPF